MGYYDGCELVGLREARNYYSWLIQEFRPAVRGKVIEVGAGIGVFSEYLLGLPIEELICLEPACNLIPLLTRRLSRERVRVFSETLKRFAANNSELFDSVVYVNVLEHIEDDHQSLVIINRLLKAKGSLCLFVPAIPWLYGALDKSFGHYRRYSKGQLENLLIRSGFKVCTLKYFHATGVLTWTLMGKILRWNSWDSRSVKLYDQIVTPIICRIERTISPPLGQSLLSIGVKVD